MKRAWLIVPVVVAAVVLIGLLRFGAEPGDSHIDLRLSRQVMGTLASIGAVGRAGSEESLRAAVAAAYAAIDRVEATMSHYREDSLVSRINREAADHPVELDEPTAHVLAQSKRYWELSNGAFDPTCGPLIELWKRCGKENRLPTEDELAAAKARTGFDKVQLDLQASPPTIRFTQPGMRVDLGGIAKGYSIDLAIDALKKAGCTGGLVDIGGDIRTFGKPADDEHWGIAVRNPFTQALLMVLAINDAAVCTSGNYHRFAEIQGHRYSHIIDPRTGRPAEVAPSVTIVGLETTGTDALATAVSVLGAGQGMELIRQLPGYEAMVVTGEPDSFQLVRSKGFDIYVAATEEVAEQ